MGANLSRRLKQRASIALLVSISGHARGQELEPKTGLAPRDACLAGHEQSQELKLQGKLLESKRALLSCAEEQCPSIVRADCVKWLDEMETAIPTIVVVAVSDKGDEINVNVAIDGKFTTNRLDGKPIELDPGVHEIDFALPGSNPQKLKLIIGQGEKNRIVRFDFRTKGSPVTLPVVVPQGPQSSAAESSPFPLMYVLGGVALAGVGAATYFGIQALVAHHDAASCEPICSRSVADDVRKKALYADLSLAVSVLAAGGMLVVNSRCPTSTPSYQPRAGLSLRDFGLSVTPSGAVTSVRGEF